MRELALIPAPPETVVGRYAPLLTDRVPAVRATAVRALGAVAEGRAALAPKLATVAADPAAEVRVAVAEELCRQMGEPDARQRLAEMLARETDPAAREALSAAVGNALPADSADVDLVRALVTSGTDNGKARGLAAVARLGPRGEPLWPTAVRLLKTESRAVRVAAIQVVGEMGPKGAAYAEAVADAIPRAWPGGPGVVPGDDQLGSAALTALGQMGEPGLPHLLRVTRRGDVPPDVRKAVCQGFAAGGEAARSAAPLVLSWVDRFQDPLVEATAFLTALGGDTVISELIARTDLTRVRGKDAYAPAVRKWALQTLGGLAFGKMSAAQRKRVIDHIRHLRASERTPENRDLAAALLARLGDYAR